MNLPRYGPLIAVFIIGIILAISGCRQGDAPQPILDSSITSAYPELYEGVYDRDAQSLLPFTNDSSAEVRRQAWRALAHTPIDSISNFISEVKQAGSPQAWFALSMLELNETQLRDLEQYWINQPEQRAGVSLVLGRQGDANTLSFLFEQLPNIIGTEYERESALAISRLVLSHDINKKQQLEVIDAAFASGDSGIIRHWLYGFYRGNSGTLSAATQDSILKKWSDFGIGESANVDQYVAGILGPSVFANIMKAYQSQGNLQDDVQLGVELGRMTSELNLSEQNIEFLKMLITHTNPHVAQQTLAGLSGRLAKNDSLYSVIDSELIQDDQTIPFVWLQALNTVATVDSAVVSSNSERLRQVANSNPYLYPQALQIWIKIESQAAVLNRLDNVIGEGETLKSMYALDALQTLWSASGKSSKLRNDVREITFNALGLKDRGVTYSSQALLQDSLLFNQSDFSRINRALNAFSLPGDIEVYQTFGSLYKQRFEEQAKPVIDSLAALGYMPLNRSLQQAGWDVDVPEEADQEFRTPNWSRLWELGTNPVWVLETNMGTIRVEMNTLSAPATISAIDSLTRVGAYDGVPFHRVVPNFVIQGGDIERQDGYGGPEFTIPTEASELDYHRGAAGIASAGPDTEGSQYFFMHQWAPHLNGGYTLFGNVIEGMNVVDRIVVGDMVKRAYWRQN